MIVWCDHAAERGAAILSALSAWQIAR